MAEDGEDQHIKISKRKFDVNEELLILTNDAKFQMKPISKIPQFVEE